MEEEFEEYEMPCTCDCGKIFDLNKGGSIMRFGKWISVCSDCAKEDEEEVIIN